MPAAWRSDNMEQLPDQGKEEINRINRELVAKLKETDSAFSLGKNNPECVADLLANRRDKNLISR